VSQIFQTWEIIRQFSSPEYVVFFYVRYGVSYRDLEKILAGSHRESYDPEPLGCPLISLAAKSRKRLIHKVVRLTRRLSLTRSMSSRWLEHVPFYQNQSTPHICINDRCNLGIVSFVGSFSLKPYLKGHIGNAGHTLEFLPT